MGRTSVQCDLCKSVAVVIGTKGELCLRDPTARARTILIIECPKCGRREQSEAPNHSANK
jgi:hypothetical protein